MPWESGLLAWGTSSWQAGTVVVVALVSAWGWWLGLGLVPLELEFLGSSSPWMRCAHTVWDRDFATSACRPQNVASTHGGSGSVSQILACHWVQPVSAIATRCAVLQLPWERKKVHIMHPRILVWSLPFFRAGSAPNGQAMVRRHVVQNSQSTAQKNAVKTPHGASQWCIGVEYCCTNIQWSDIDITIKTARFSL